MEKMEKCLICDKPRKGGELKCKLCNMGIVNGGISYKEFVFCCNDCRESFIKMLIVSDSSEKKELMERDVVI